MWKHYCYICDTSMTDYKSQDTKKYSLYFYTYNKMLSWEVMYLSCLQSYFSSAIFIRVFSVALRPNAGHGLLILEVSRSHTTTYHVRYDSSGRVISSSQRPLPDNTQYSQHTNIHAPGGIRTHDLGRGAAANLRLRPRGHWDRLFGSLVT